MSMAIAEEVYEFLKRAHDSVQPLSEHIYFDKTNRLHSHIIFLYGSIIELTGSCILLIEHGLMAAVPVILRSILEAYVDLHNLIEDPRYGYSMEISDLEGSLVIMKEEIFGSNKYLSGDAKSKQKCLQHKQRIEGDLKALRSRGHKYMSIKKRFEKAGMLDEYKSIYTILSSETHNNLIALIKRHTEINEGDFDVTVYRSYSWNDYQTHVGLNSEILIRASLEVHGFFNSPMQEDVLALRQELDRYRGD